MADAPSDEGRARAVSVPELDRGTRRRCPPSGSSLARAMGRLSAIDLPDLTPGKSSTGFSDTLETLEQTASSLEKHSKGGLTPTSRKFIPSASPSPFHGRSMSGSSASSQHYSHGGAKELTDLPIDFITQPSPDRKPRPGTSIVVLLIAKRKKVMSKPMFEIMSRLVQFRELDICVLDEALLTGVGQEEWPPCDCLIAFASSKYPLAKVEAYAERVKPVLINDLAMQHVLQDRRKVFRLIRENGIPVPDHVVITDDEHPGPGEYRWDEIEERDDAIAVKGGGVLLQRPFVEKPANADDHNICVYFREDDGGGCQILFRKTDNRCSEYVPGEQPIKKEGTKIYERFIATGGTDIKVYTVTGLYAHAEGRKAPVVDGKVLRDASGKELRCPIVLTAVEKQIALRVVEVFKQQVCGFDLLRDQNTTPMRSFVCDVNGWSFVKRARSYFEDCTEILHRLIVTRCGKPHGGGVRVGAPIDIFTSRPPPEAEQPVGERGQSANSPDMGELVCVIAIVRHGERTPKQKSKHKSVRSEWIELYTKYATDPLLRREVKLKHPRQLTSAISAGRAILADADASEEERARSATIVDVLERFPLQGINRKLQIKPLEWDGRFVEAGSGAESGGAESTPGPAAGDGVGAVTKVQVTLKWGGWLTENGLRQARKEGEKFRKSMYPNDGRGGLLRLHSTYRHDLKVYSSDEGRVQTTAAAFAKGLLGLDGSIPPILASLIQKGPAINELLDDCTAAKAKLQRVKERLHTMLTKDCPVSDIPELNPEGAKSIQQALTEIGNPRSALTKLGVLMERLVDALTKCARTAEPLYDAETLSAMHDRWDKVLGEFVQQTDPPLFNASKISDVYDCARYDWQHNALESIRDVLREIFLLSKALAFIVVPQEYGMTKEDKVSIARKITLKLRRKIIKNLHEAARLPVQGSKGSKGARAKAAAGAAGAGGSGSPETAAADAMAAAAKADHDEHDHDHGSGGVTRFNKRGAGFLDMQVRSPERFVRTRVYVTSESHCYAMMELLRVGGYADLVRSCDGHDAERGQEAWDEAMHMLSSEGVLGELTQVVCRLYEHADPDNPIAKKHMVQWLISTGQRAPEADSPQKLTEIAPMVEMHHGMPLARVEEFLGESWPKSKESDS